MAAPADQGSIRVSYGWALSGAHMADSYGWALSGAHMAVGTATVGLLGFRV
jgi:hypothetical protein